MYEFTMHSSRHQKKSFLHHFRAPNESICGAVMITSNLPHPYALYSQVQAMDLNFFVAPLSEWSPYFPTDVSCYVDIMSTTLMSFQPIIRTFRLL
jgi:hypothetical protein